ncbi:hypothetical protein EVAR_19502_1 [Eumeta japonica]|uniref:Uncharacterized protein n=1 Tax=Eumeta variegata TaxID=151549 RepID=A0A4C1V8U7_EUMVA|nr:hypothetical protein EVAR_19502_1 [Eumeta japonica]
MSESSSGLLTHHLPIPFIRYPMSVEEGGKALVTPIRKKKPPGEEKKRNCRPKNKLQKSFLSLPDELVLILASEYGLFYQFHLIQKETRDTDPGSRSNGESEIPPSLLNLHARGSNKKKLRNFRFRNIVIATHVREAQEGAQRTMKVTIFGVSMYLEWFSEKWEK